MLPVFRAVRGDDLAVRQTHVCEEAFVTLHERAANEASFEAHGKLTAIFNYLLVSKCSTVIGLCNCVETIPQRTGDVAGNRSRLPGVHELMRLQSPE